ncbi:MAG: SDR family oxidoreductase [Hyphomicrobiales bacterium]
MKIENAVALVTGANRGLGRQFAEQLLAHGAARVYAGARNPDALAPLIDAHGERIVPLRLDVTQPDTIVAAIRQAGDLTFLVNNAGVLEARGLIEAGSVEPMQREMEVNVFGLASMSLACAPVIAGNGGGAILNMLSVAGLANFPAFGTYSASKAAAMSLTHCMRYELKDRGIEVFGVYAGLIDTDMIDFVDGEKTDPRVIVTAAFKGVEDGVMDIDTDARCEYVRGMLREDPAGLEAALWARSAQFKTVS